MTQDIIEAFKAAMRDHDIDPPQSIMADGQLHRFHIAGQRSGSQNGAYKLHLDGARPAGYFEDFKRGIKTTWKADQPAKPLTDAERRQLKQQQQEYAAKKAAEAQAREEGYKTAAERARWIWHHATPISDSSQHPHLVSKRIQPHGARLYRGRLTYPLYDQSRELVSLRYIYADGTKRPLPGAKKPGAFGIIGQVKTGDVLLIAEGFSTAASLHEATGHPVFIAVDCCNLEATARAVRHLYPDAKIIVCADNDTHGAGQKHAWKAAKACQGFYCVTDTPGTDFNDLHCMEASHE